MNDVLEKPPRKRKRRFEKRPRDQIRPIAITERIKRILLLLYDYRFLRTDQIEDLLFWEGYSKQYTNRRLSDLYDRGFVDKPEKQKEVRWREGGGSDPDIYALGDEGAKYLEHAFGIPRSTARWRDKNRQVENPHIEHTLLNAEIMLAFERTCARRTDVRLIYPREILALAPEETRSARKPFEWRVTTRWDNTELSIPVAPDFKLFGLEFLALPAPRNRVWFALEADTGSETLIPENLKNVSKTTPFHKYLGYCATYQERLHQERFGVVHSFRVLSVTALNGLQYVRDRQSGTIVARTRIENMQEAALLAGKACVDRNPGFYLFADLPSLKQHDDVLTMPWHTAKPGKRAILDLKR